ncbi:hypothetical protein [Deinococcus peraridilitoris]|uniref:Uncharacterized protein n=1 Tax=Deinococcus peraridilitoris (strain DSM 19664 / LMG 22246 / CIP 109416 / KR-200) TaxID=937777 RepID=L0A4C0_DEIPD|nr:hypothetical protein [Deinococcus peraridilitoris]AFZ68027.1 hypothetical protein Deipe_2562 [Deinococcus peraridilitoris DSM 19664]
MTVVSTLKDALTQGARVAARHASETGRPGKLGVEAARDHLKGKQDPLQEAWAQNTRELQVLHAPGPVVAFTTRDHLDGPAGEVDWIVPVVPGKAGGVPSMVLPLVILGAAGGGVLLWRSAKVRAWVQRLRTRLRSRSNPQTGHDPSPEAGQERSSGMVVITSEERPDHRA